MRRSWLIQLFLVALTIAAGLHLRGNPAQFSPGIVKFGGDGLWALLVFLGVGFVRPRLPTNSVALVALLVCYAMEFSQLYHSAWIDNLRNTWVGHMFLGTTFNWPDLIAYTFGVSLGIGIERFAVISPSDISRLRR